MKIGIAADHGGYQRKEEIKAFLTDKGISVRDFGSESEDSVDYPDYAALVAQALVEGEVEQGILICTTGLGMAMSANRYPHMRAALCTTPKLAQMARAHNDANVLVLGAQVTDTEASKAIVSTWLEYDFLTSQPRHARRIAKQTLHASFYTETDAVRGVDPTLCKVIEQETIRQRETLNLIASENGVSRAVRQAQGSLLTNKYAEGYPGKRWYSGCDFVDEAERLAIERAKTLFGAEYANVQPHCGSSANMAVYAAALEPGDTILAMSLAHGGHLTHGSPVNFSGKLYHVVPYGVSKETGLIDFAEVARLAREHAPKMIVAGASAYPRELAFDQFREIADEVGAAFMVDMAHIAGLVAGGVHPSPVPHAEYVTTTTHKTLRGPRSGMVLCREPLGKAVDKAVFPGLQGGPLMHVIAAKAVCFQEALQPTFRAYAQQVVDNARAMAERFLQEGLTLVSGGTDNHLLLMDVAAEGATGKAVAAALDAAGIIVNKNAIPFDTKSPFVTSGIRIGTPGVTSRGMGLDEMHSIADWIAAVVRDPDNAALQQRIRGEVAALCQAFPAMQEG